jgi:hypothetical protein
VRGAAACPAACSSLRACAAGAACAAAGPGLPQRAAGQHCPAARWPPPCPACRRRRRTRPSPLPPRPSPHPRRSSQHFQERLSSYLAYQIRSDLSPIYGDGFRAAYEAFQGVGLKAVVDSVLSTGKLPRH